MSAFSSFGSACTSRLAVLLAGIFVASGCTTVTPTSDILKPWGDSAKAATGPDGATAEKPGTVTVEFHGDYMRSKPKQVAITPEMTVKDVLKKSGALSGFGSIEASLLRQTPDGQVVKMNIDVLPGKRGVKVESDYAVYAGDRIMVKDKTTTALDGMLEGLTGPVVGGGMR